ncbi:MAG: PAS domain S-box protein, partial [Betaproteobacteria bacterium]|nr:PAS domain S-box protein [Betaproteobacteria bacterium]
MHDVLDPMREAIGEDRRRSVETLLAYHRGGQVSLLGGQRGATWETLDYQAGDDGIAGLVATERVQAIAETLDPRGIEVLAAARRVPTTDWHVIVKADRSEIYRTTLQLAQFGLAVLVLLMLALVVSIAMIRRRAQEDVQARTADAELRIEALTEHFELASRHANDIILLVGPDGVVVQANERAVETYGYSRKELIGLAVTALQPEGMNDEGPTVRRFGDTGTLALIFETVHRRKDGSTIPVEVSARRFKIGDQKYSQAIVRNISERKIREAEMLCLAAERDLMAAQLRLQFDGMPFACVITDMDLHVMDANPAFEVLFGWTAGELAGRGNLDRIVDPADLPGVLKVLEFLRSGPGPLVNVNRNRTRDGRVITCRWTNTALRTADGKFAGLLAVCEDLTTELELKHEVEAGEATFEALARTAPVGVFQLGPDGAISYANPMLIEMLGIGTGNPQNLARALYLLPEDRPRAAQLLRKVLDGTVMAPQEFRYTGKNGVSGWLLVHAH